MEETALPEGVHLVGSIPLRSRHEVFTAAADGLGDRLRRIPDGETGPRADWIVWQYPVFSSLPQLEVASPGPASYRALSQLRLRDGDRGDPIVFDDLGYARTAIASYREFAELKQDGRIAPDCRFLVSLPTPLAPVTAFVDVDDQPQVEEAYEARMLAEIDEMLRVIPAGELAIQWDARYEFSILDGAVATWFTDARAGVLERLLRLGDRVPAEVELGYHLCSGDDEHGHFIEPDDAGQMVDVANALSAGIARPLNWIHMPVPESHHDDEYCAPMAGLDRRPETELYLGVIHRADADAGALERIEAARRHVDGFGVATECGWGRGGAAAVRGLIELHRRVSAPVRG